METSLSEHLTPQEFPLLGLMEEMQHGIVFANKKGQICYWNKGAENLFGYSRDEVLGQSLTLIMPERYRQGCGLVRGIRILVGT